MTKVIAYFAMMTLMLLTSLANYWYTFGLWPRSWWAYGGFFVLQTLLMAAVTLVNKDE